VRKVIIVHLSPIDRPVLLPFSPRPCLHPPSPSLPGFLSQPPRHRQKRSTRGPTTFHFSPTSPTTRHDTPIMSSSEEKVGIENVEAAHVDPSKNGTPVSADDFGFTEREQKAIIRRIDRRLVLTVGALYCISLMDRTNLGFANIAGMAVDLELIGNRYVSLSAAGLHHHHHMRLIHLTCFGGATLIFGEHGLADVLSLRRVSSPSSSSSPMSSSSRLRRSSAARLVPAFTSRSLPSPGAPS
jgi:hypothetical protein